MISQELVDAAAVIFRFTLAFFFLTAALRKLFARDEFERAVANYALLPTPLIQPVARWLPLLELLCAFALLIGAAVAPIALGTGSLLVAFALAVALNLARGREFDCGCNGAVAPRSIGWGLVAGDLALAAMAVVVALVNPAVLAFSLPGLSASVSPLSSQDGLALLLLAGAVVLGLLINSTRVRLSPAMRALRTEGEAGA
ncbi:hypothetical protein BH18ACT12_BH18ACT12_24390 [soil metagenome]